VLTRQVFRLMASASFVGATVWACSGGTGSNTGFGNDTSSTGGSTNGSNTSNNGGSGNSSNYGSGGTSTNGGGTSTVGGGTSTVGGGSSTTAGSSSIVGGGTTGCAGAAGSIYAPTTCDATKAASALPVSNCYYTGTTGTAAMGYVYPYGDGVSTGCVDSAALCGKGAPAAAGPTFANYGSGFGVNVNQASGASTSGSVMPTATGLTWAVTGTMPAYGIQISITAGTGSCSAASGCCFRPGAAVMSGVTPWSMFTQFCYNSPAEAGAGLQGTDGIAKINFQAITGAAATTYDFCVTSLSF
jgi:hypothetical protein